MIGKMSSNGNLHFKNDTNTLAVVGENIIGLKSKCNFQSDFQDVTSAIEAKTTSVLSEIDSFFNQLQQNLTRTATSFKDKVNKFCFNRMQEVEVNEKLSQHTLRGYESIVIGSESHFKQPDETKTNEQALIKSLDKLKRRSLNFNFFGNIGCLDKIDFGYIRYFEADPNKVKIGFKDANEDGIIKICQIGGKEIISINFVTEQDALLKNYLSVVLKDPEGYQVRVRVFDNLNGIYYVLFVPRISGMHEMRVTLYGRPIVGSPFKIEVTDSRHEERVGDQSITKHEMMSTSSDGYQDHRCRSLDACFGPYFLGFCDSQDDNCEGRRVSRDSGVDERGGEYDDRAVEGKFLVDERGDDDDVVEGSSDLQFIKVVDTINDRVTRSTDTNALHDVNHLSDIVNSHSNNNNHSHINDCKNNHDVVEILTEEFLNCPTQPHRSIIDQGFMNRYDLHYDDYLSNFRDSIIERYDTARINMFRTSYLHTLCQRSRAYFPIGLMAHDGNVLVCDTDESVVKIYREVDDVMVATLKRVRKDCLQRPSALLVRDGRVYVKDDRAVHVFDLETCSFIDTIGANKMEQPYGLCWTENNELAVFDEGKNVPTLCIFPPQALDGSGQRSCKEHEFKPLSLPVNGKHPFPPSKCRFMESFADRIFVSDLGRNVVYATNQRGVTKFRFGTTGKFDAGQFDQPSGITCDADGNLLVADSKNNRIQVFNAYGKALGLLRMTENVSRPSDIFLCPKTNNLYVSNLLGHSVKVFKLLPP